MQWSNITWGSAEDFSVCKTAVGDGFYFCTFEVWKSSEWFKNSVLS